jgi:hypothetical protein
VTVLHVKNRKTNDTSRKECERGQKLGRTWAKDTRSYRQKACKDARSADNELTQAYWSSKLFESIDLQVADPKETNGILPVPIFTRQSTCTRTGCYGTTCKYPC